MICRSPLESTFTLSHGPLRPATQSEASSRRREHDAGIARLIARSPESSASHSSVVRAAFDDLLDAVRDVNALSGAAPGTNEFDRYYPGSPTIALRMMRPCDRLEVVSRSRDVSAIRPISSSSESPLCLPLSLSLSPAQRMIGVCRDALSTAGIERTVITIDL